MPFPLIATKLYLYYDDAWWVYLNKTTGSLNDPNFGNATTYNDTNLFTTPPLRGRYHDGGECAPMGCWALQRQANCLVQPKRHAWVGRQRLDGITGTELCVAVHNAHGVRYGQ